MRAFRIASAMRSVMQLSCSALLLLAGGAHASAGQASSFASLGATLKEAGAQLEVRRFRVTSIVTCMCIVRLLRCASSGSVLAARCRPVCRV